MTTRYARGRNPPSAAAALTGAQRCSDSRLLSIEEIPYDVWKRTDVRVGHQAKLDDISRRRRAKRLFMRLLLEDSRKLIFTLSLP